MIEILQSYDLTTLQWALLGLCAVIVGMAKTGVAGIYTVVVPILAIIFGGKDSTGILLPILIMADVFGVSYYNRATNWKFVWKIIPWALLGVVIATLVGEYISDQWFNRLMAAVILMGVVVLILMEMRKTKTVPDYLWFAALMGVLGGFTTMLGNSAGPIMAVYLLAMHLPKNTYIGTTAWFFFIINLSKLPFHIFVWQTISVDSLVLNLSMLPMIALGAIVGIWIIRHIPETMYRRFVLIVTVLSAFLLFFK
jgi:uncharacterized membrane protein YfcA